MNVNSMDFLGLAYFAYRPLSGFLFIFGVTGNNLDDALNTVIGHEQLFFEDGKPDSNIGFFDDGTLKQETDISKYKSSHSSGYDDKMMRKAVKNIQLKKYELLGKKDQFNCQDWAEDVRKEYYRLLNENQKKKNCP